MKAEYSGRDHLDFAARNYVENVRREETGMCGTSAEVKVCCKVGPPELTKT